MIPIFMILSVFLAFSPFVPSKTVLVIVCTVISWFGFSCFPLLGIRYDTNQMASHNKHPDDAAQLTEPVILER